MSPAELAALDTADRRRVLVAALHEAERGLALRAAQHGRTDAMSRNVDRLRRELAAHEERARSVLRVNTTSA